MDCLAFTNLLCHFLSDTSAPLDSAEWLSPLEKWEQKRKMWPCTLLKQFMVVFLKLMIDIFQKERFFYLGYCETEPPSPIWPPGEWVGSGDACRQPLTAVCVSTVSATAPSPSDTQVKGNFGDECNRESYPHKLESKRLGFTGIEH